MAPSSQERSPGPEVMRVLIWPRPSVWTGLTCPQVGRGWAGQWGWNRASLPCPVPGRSAPAEPCPACPSGAQTASWTLGHQGQAPRKWPCLRWPLGALTLTLIGTCGPEVLHPSPAPTQGDCVHGGLWPWPCLLPSFSCSQGLLPPALESW